MSKKLRRLVVAVVGAPLLMAGFLVVAAGADEDGQVATSLPDDVPGIPAILLDAYLRAARATPDLAPRCRGMRWSILAGIGKVESDQAGRSLVHLNGNIVPAILGPRLDGTNNTVEIRDTDDGRWDFDTAYDRAVGPLQFIPSTWKHLGRDGNGDGTADPNNAYDATYAAVVHLCGTRPRDFSDRRQLADALYGYNQMRSYVTNVLRWVDHYDAYIGKASLPTSSGNGSQILAAAMRWRGTPYSWGGGDASGPSYGGCCSPGGQDGSTIKGFDCSGLTIYALGQVGVRGVQHSATWQFRNAERLGAQRISRSQGMAALRPGDIVWFSTTPTNPEYTHHVGIYAGNGQMINAPRPGKNVGLDPVDLGEYAGAARW
ncbi:C40 family peptidase [Flindersiella endophytica]